MGQGLEVEGLCRAAVEADLRTRGTLLCEEPRVDEEEEEEDEGGSWRRAEGRMSALLLLVLLLAVELWLWGGDDVEVCDWCSCWLSVGEEGEKGREGRQGEGEREVSAVQNGSEGDCKEDTWKSHLGSGGEGREWGEQ